MSFVLICAWNYEQLFFDLKKGTKSVVTDDSSSDISQSELQKQKEESLRREIEQEKMLREKFQRELEEMKQKLSKLSTTPSQLTTLPLPLEVS